MSWVALFYTTLFVIFYKEIWDNCHYTGSYFLCTTLLDLVNEIWWVTKLILSKQDLVTVTYARPYYCYLWRPCYCYLCKALLLLPMQNLVTVTYARRCYCYLCKTLLLLPIQDFVNVTYARPCPFRDQSWITCLWFVNHESISSSHKLKNCITSIFHELFFPK